MIQKQNREPRVENLRAKLRNHLSRLYMGTMSRYSLHGLSREVFLPQTEGPTGCSYPQLSQSGIWRLNIPVLFCVPFPFVSAPVFLSMLNSVIMTSVLVLLPRLCLSLSWIVLFFVCVYVLSVVFASACLCRPPLPLMSPSTACVFVKQWSVSILQQSGELLNSAGFLTLRLTMAERYRKRNILVVVEVLAFLGSV